jgi:hypothetical protein
VDDREIAVVALLANAGISFAVTVNPRDLRNCRKIILTSNRKFRIESPTTSR